MKSNITLLIALLSIFVAQSVQLKKPCNTLITKPAQCAPCTLSGWAEKIFRLKERPVEFSTLPSKEEYQSILTLSEFINSLQKCAAIIADSSKNNNLWLGGTSIYSLAPEIFTLNRSYKQPADSIENFTFKPYVSRLILEPGATAILFGDLHGSVHSLIRDLLKLRTLGDLDDNFKITKKNVHILFLGDYISRGIYGVEVIYTLTRLKIANPLHVHVIRGNHEDYILAPDFKRKHTSEEEKDNAPSFIDELYAKFDLTQKHEVTIFRFYETLPLALYLGCGTSTHKDYMMCCHGGLEIGYNPHDFLHAPTAITCEHIEQLSRKTNFTTLLTKKSQDAIKCAFSLDALCGDLQNFVPKAPFFKITPTHTTYNGFMWNDFYVDPTKIVGQRKKSFTGWVFGKQLAEEVLAWGNSKEVTLRGVFRAHQHNNSTGGPMLNLLCCKKGIAHIWDKYVYTLLSAPDSKLEGTGEECFTYDSFVRITTAQEFDKWKIVHYFQDNGMEKKIWKTRISYPSSSPVKSCPAAV